jgi:hypothetical protein
MTKPIKRGVQGMNHNLENLFSGLILSYLEGDTLDHAIFLTRIAGLVEKEGIKKEDWNVIKHFVLINQ